MRTKLSAAAIGSAFIVVLCAVTPASAHRLDEYLQATTINITAERVVVQMRLTPGVAVFNPIITRIDADGDGVIAPAEAQNYAEQVRGDLALSIDGTPLPLRLTSSTFPKVEQMKAGLGEILLDFEADLPRGGLTRSLIFDTHHQAEFASYLVNALVPSDPRIRITAQHRNVDQSHYQLDYTFTDAQSAAGMPVVLLVWLVVDALAILGWLGFRFGKSRKVAAI